MTPVIRFLFGLLILQFFLPVVRSTDWPMLRGDAARGGYTAESIPNQLSERWRFKPPHPPRPSWPTAERMKFDRANQPIIIGDLDLEFADDKVHALMRAPAGSSGLFHRGANRCAGRLAGSHLCRQR